MVRSLYFTNRKEYYRRKKISEALKSYWADVKSGKITRGKRIRKQVVYNSGYGISIRAITTDHNKTYDDLRNEIDSSLLSNSQLLNIFGDVTNFDEGLETEEIDSDEDKSIKDIVVEVNIRGSVNLLK